jgi:hypothetical protein
MININDWPHLSIFCSKSSFSLRRRQLRVYQKRDSGYDSPASTTLTPHTCRRVQQQRHVVCFKCQVKTPAVFHFLRSTARLIS